MLLLNIPRPFFTLTLNLFSHVPVFPRTSLNPGQVTSGGVTSWGNTLWRCSTLVSPAEERRRCEAGVVLWALFWEGSYLFAHPDLHHSVVYEGFTQIFVFLLLEALHVHQAPLNMLPAQTQALRAVSGPASFRAVEKSPVWNLFLIFKPAPDSLKITTCIICNQTSLS